MVVVIGVDVSGAERAGGVVIAHVQRDFVPITVKCPRKRVSFLFCSLATGIEHHAVVLADAGKADVGEVDIPAERYGNLGFNLGVNQNRGCNIGVI